MLNKTKTICLLTAMHTGAGSPSDYMQYTFTATASSNSTVLTFSGLRGVGDAGGEIPLDDVSVTPSSVPEPSGLLLLGTAALSLFQPIRRKSSTYTRKSWCRGARMTRVLLTILAAALSVSVCHATSITYTLSTTASGTLDGDSFMSAPVTVTLTGDTSNIVPGPPPHTGVVVNPGTATVNVSGIGTDTFTDSIVIVSTLNDLTIFGVPAVFMLDATTNTGILLQTGSEFTTYDLGTSLGPVSGTGGVASGSSIIPVFPTVGGELTWAVGQSLGGSTFTAVTTTPEPGTLFLVGSGLAAVLTRRRFKTSRPS